MSNFIPMEKMNKRQRAALNKQRRQTWDFKPITRVKPSAKVYNRKKAQYAE